MTQYNSLLFLSHPVDRLVYLGFPTLHRRLRGDMIEVFKITKKHKYDYKVVSELIYNINKVTRANDYRLSKIEVILILGNIFVH